MNYTLKDYYRRIRPARKTCKAVDAIRYAREYQASGKAPYYIDGRPSIFYNRANGDGCRWVEYPENGLRVKGYADEVAQRIQHKGWFINDFQSEVYRGQVFQIPARNGLPRFLAGYEDAHGNNAALIDFSSFYDDETEAAYAADRMAERDAEKEREYNEAWQAGSRYAEAGEEIKQGRKAARRIIGALREAMKNTAPFTPETVKVICDNIRAGLRRELRGMQEAREERKELKSGVYRSQYEAFNEGAGENVLPVNP